MSRKILFFGNERLATGVSTTAPTLQALISAGYEVMAVVVAQNESGRSRQTRELEIGVVAQSHNIPVISPGDLNKAKNELSAFGAEIAVLVAYGKIVPENIISIFPHGIINIHPSLLPNHRGPTPIENTILKAELETGVSLMQLSAKMDAGPIFAQQTLHLNGTETKQALADQLSQAGGDMVIKYLPKILEDRLKTTPQSDAAATYDKLIAKTDGKLDWTKPAILLEREIRAYAGWPRSRAMISDTDVIVTKARVANGKGDPGRLWTDNKQLGVYTGNDVLVIDSLIPAGKKEMSAQAYLAGR